MNSGRASSETCIPFLTFHNLMFGIRTLIFHVEKETFTFRFSSVLFSLEKRETGALSQELCFS